MILDEPRQVLFDKKRERNASGCPVSDHLDVDENMTRSKSQIDERRFGKKVRTTAEGKHTPLNSTISYF